MGQETSITPGHVISKPCLRLKHTETEDRDIPTNVSTKPPKCALYFFISEGNYSNLNTKGDMSNPIFRIVVDEYETLMTNSSTLTLAHPIMNI